jgi:hypothetical protein
VEKFTERVNPCVVTVDTDTVPALYGPWSVTTWFAGPGAKLGDATLKVVETGGDVVVVVDDVVAVTSDLVLAALG